MRLLLWTAVLTAAVVVASLLALQTRAAKDRLAAWLTTLTADSATARVVFGRIDGRLPFDARVATVTIADDEGVWLSIEGVELDLAVSALLLGQVRVSEARADRLAMPRLPQSDDEPEEERRVHGYLPTIVVGGLRIASASVGPELLGGWAPGELEVRAHGSLRLSDLVLDVTGDVRAPHLAPLSVAEHPLSIGSVQLDGRVTGPAESPTLHWSGRTGALAWRDLVSDGLVLELRGGPSHGGYGLAVDASLSELALGATAVASTAASADARDADMEALVAVLGASVHIGAEVDFVRDDGPIDLTRVEIATDGVSVRLRDGVFEQSGRVSLPSTSLMISDLAQFRRWLPLLSSGSATLELILEGDRTQGTADAAISLALTGLEPADPRLESLVRGDTTLSSVLHLDADGKLRASDIVLDSAGGIRAEGALDVDTSGDGIGATVHAVLPDAGLVRELVGTELQGRVDVEATITGTHSAFSVDATAYSDSIGMVGAAPLSTRVHLEAADLPDAAHGTVRANLVSDAGPATCGAAFRFVQSSGLQLDDMYLQGASMTVRGNAIIDTTRRTVDGHLAGDVTSLETFASLLGYEGAGAAHFELDAGAKGTRQDARLSVDGGGVSLVSTEGDRLVVDTVQLRARVEDVYGTPSGSVSMNVADAVLDDLQVSSLVVEGSGVGGVWNVAARTAGRRIETFELNAAVTLDVDLPTVRGEITRLSGAIAGEALRLGQPLVLLRDEGVFSADDVDLRLSDAKLIGSFAVRNGRPEGRLELTKLPLTLLRLYDRSLVMTGILSGTVHADPAEAVSTVVIALSADEVVVQAAEDEQLAPFSARVDATWRPESISLAARLQSDAATDLRVDALLPLRAGGAAAAGGAPLQIEIDGRADLGLLEGLVNVGEDTFRGSIEANLSITGTVDAPLVRGVLAMSDGAYASSASGVVVTGVTMRVEGDGTRLVLRELHGSDGNGGSLRAAGSVNLAGGISEAVYDAEVVLESFWIVRIDEATAKANGRLSLSGRGTALSLGGTIDTVSAELRAPDRLPPDIVRLDVEEKNLPFLDGAARGRVDTSRSVPIALDVTIRMPDRVTFRATDIDTEWKGKLHIGGMVESPEIEGSLHLVRGIFGALGIRFNATQGSLRFDGGAEIDPGIDLIAEASRNDIVARIRVFGTASDFSLDLTSEPSLPTDEIVSRLLYGESPSNLSTAQTIQVAAAVARLTRRGGTDPLDWVRRTFGVDRVAIEGGDSGSAGSFSVGKYLTRGVFMSVDQGLTGDVSKASIEIEVTPHINLESELGTDSQGSLGVNWRWRY